MRHTPTPCVKLNGQFFQMLGPDTRAMGRFCMLRGDDLSVAESAGFSTYLGNTRDSKYRFDRPPKRS